MENKKKIINKQFSFENNSNKDELSLALKKALKNVNLNKVNTDINSKIEFVKKNEKAIRILYENNKKFEDYLKDKLKTVNESYRTYIVVSGILGLVFLIILIKSFNFTFFGFTLFLSIIFGISIRSEFKRVESLKEEIKTLNIESELYREVQKFSENEKILKMEDGFEDLSDFYLSDKSTWGKLIFLLIIIMIITPILLIFNTFGINLDLAKNFTHTILYAIFNISIFLGLYFCSKQYNKSKNLMIENFNKVAIIEGFYGLKNEKSIKLDSYLDNFLDVVFTRPKFYNEKSLPIEEFTKLAEIFSKINKNK